MTLQKLKTKKLSYNYKCVFGGFLRSAKRFRKMTKVVFLFALSFKVPNIREYLLD